MGSVLLGQDQRITPCLNLFVCSGPSDSTRTTSNARYHAADCSSSPQQCSQDSRSLSPPEALRNAFILTKQSLHSTLTPSSLTSNPATPQNQLCVRKLAAEKPCDYFTVISERTGNKLKLLLDHQLRSTHCLHGAAQWVAHTVLTCY